MSRALRRAALASALASAPLAAQGLASRVAAAPSSGALQFTYAARPGLCGNGRTWYSMGGTSFYGSFDSDYTRMSTDQCVAGPVRVVLDISDRTVVGLRTFVGPVPTDAAVINLGNYGTSAAADYLMSLAGSSEGRIGPQALGAAMLADSVDLTDRLLGIARDNARPLETRRSAVSALVSSPTSQSSKISEALIGIARNENETQSLRQRALSSLSRIGHGDGIPGLIQHVTHEEVLAVANKAGARLGTVIKGVVAKL